MVAPSWIYSSNRYFDEEYVHGYFDSCILQRVLGWNINVAF